MMTREQANSAAIPVSVLQNVKGFKNIDDNNSSQSHLSQLSKMVKKGQPNEKPKPSKGQGFAFRFEVGFFVSKINHVKQLL